MKHKFGVELAKGRIHDGRYSIAESGPTVRINVWAHGCHAEVTYTIKGAVRDAYDDGEIGNILRQTAERMRTLQQMMNKWGVDHAAPVRTVKRNSLRSANDSVPIADKNPLKRIQV